MEIVLNKTELTGYYEKYTLFPPVYFGLDDENNAIMRKFVKRKKKYLEFIEENEDLLQDWWHVDQLIQFIKRPIDFDFAYHKAKSYLKSDKPFVRRWGYVLFLAGLQKDCKNTSIILSLLKDDDEYYVQMAEAWLICDLAIYNTSTVVNYLDESKLKYNIFFLF